jgi:hypothetical protein
VAALSALARNHSISRPARRQRLVTHLEPLQQQSFLGRMASVVYRLLLVTFSNSSSSAAGAPSYTSVGNLARLVVSLSSSLLQSLGKKGFGKGAVEVLGVSVDFAETVAGNAQLGPLLFERGGLALTAQLLELVQVLAESTAASSPTVNEQAATTHRLLCCIAAKLSDDRICAELLQPVSLA